MATHFPIPASLKYIDEHNCFCGSQHDVIRDTVEVNEISMTQTPAHGKFRRLVHMKHNDQCDEALTTAINGFADCTVFGIGGIPTNLIKIGHPYTLACGLTTNGNTEIYISFGSSTLSCFAIDLIDDDNKTYRYTFTQNDGKTQISYEEKTIPVVYIIKCIMMRLFENEIVSAKTLKFEMSIEKDWIQIVKRDKTGVASPQML